MRARLLPAILVPALCVLASDTYSQSCTPPSFTLQDLDPTGTQPNAVVAADFDSNGFVDVAVGNEGSPWVSIFMGQAGGFSAGVTLNVSSGTSLDAADVDHDGNIDLAIVGEGGDDIYIALGDGAGDFTTPALITPSATAPRDVKIGDFDNNGDLDLVVGYRNSGIAVHLGDGTGGFATPAIFPMGMAEQLAVADLDRDGFLDVVTTEVVLSDIHVALGRGNGSFDPPTTFATGLVPFGLAIEDFDKNGTLDVVTVDQGAATLTFLRGIGDGTFAATNTIGAPSSNIAMIDVGDFDNDGRLDLVVPGLSDGQISVYLGDGTGDFTGPAAFFAPVPQAAVVGDFGRADGRDDFVVTLWGSNEIGYFENDYNFDCPNPSFAQLGKQLNAGDAPFPIVVGDFDLDGNPDVINADRNDDTVSVWLGLGNGELSSRMTFPTGNSPISMVAADFTSDGFLDLVTANTVTDDLTLLVNDGSGSFPGSIPLPGLGDSPGEVAAADVSFDGKIDLIVTLAGGSVAVAHGDGTGGFNPYDFYAAGPRPEAVTIGDFNNDGSPDIAVTDWITEEVITLGNVGDGTFVLGTNTFVGGGQPTSVRMGRFNGDGNLDVVVSYGFGPGAQVRTLLGDGALGFTLGPPILLNAGPLRPEGLSVADFDGNGILDVGVASYDLEGVTLLRGDGAGGFTGSELYSTGVFAGGAVHFDDLDRDGAVDLFATLPDFDLLVVAPGNGNGRFAPGFFASGGTDTRSVASADFDLDGMLDLVVANTDTDTFSYYRATGGGGFAPEISFSVSPAMQPNWVTTGDFNGDGYPDVVTTDELTFTISFFKNDRSGGFDPPLTFALLGAPSMARAADLDWDGDLDLAVISQSFVEIVINDGTGNFTTLPPSALGLSGNGNGLVVEDFDHDGDLDIAAASTNRIDVFWQSGLHTWDPGPVLFVSGTAGDFDVGDFDGDGLLDFVVPTNAFQVDLMTSNGVGAWVFGNAFATPADPFALRVADINLDGNADFVVSARGSNELHLWVGSGTGFELASLSRTLGIQSPAWLTLADFDMDSRPDIAVVPDSQFHNVPRGGVSVVLNTNCLTQRLWLLTDVSSCQAPGTPFPSQPTFSALDDGLNSVVCEMGPVTASFVPGTNPGGASLGGTNPVNLVFGGGGFSDLSVNLPGAGYQLEFGHPLVPRKTRSITFSQGLMPDIIGPPAVCELDTAVYDAGADYDMFNWSLDSTPVSMARQVDLTLLFTPGIRTVDLDIVQDSCPAADTQLVEVTANFTGVSITPPGPESVCDICTGNVVTASVSDGGLMTYQWGYRTISAGPITTIPGEAGPAYTIDGTDFPSTGTFYLVVTATPTCGTAGVSNEVQVDVSTATAPNPPTALTTLATNTQNFLEWTTPLAGPCTDIRIIRRQGAFPTDPLDVVTPNFLVGDFACPGSGKDSFADSGLLNDTKYHYTAWTWDGTSYSSEVTRVTGRPFNNLSGNVLWAYATGATSVGAPGLRVLSGVGTVYIVSNDSRVHAVDGASGVWPANWKPTVIGGPAQSRPPATRFPVGSGGFQAVNGAVFVGSQDGDTYAIDGDEGDLVWQQNVAGMVQAAPAGIFTGFGGAQNLILVGSRDTGLPNVFRAFDVEDGTPAWTFHNSPAQGGDGTDIGIVAGGAAVDYTDERVFFASHEAASWSMWSVDFSGGSPVLQWTVGLGDVETSPVYLRSPNRVVVGDNSSRVHMLDADDFGNPLWTPYDASDGPVKGFVFPHFGTPFYIFTTTSQVQSVRDNGVGFVPSLNWLYALTSPSTPLYIPGTKKVLVGGNNGQLVQLSDVDTTTPTPSIIVLGDGLSVVGAPTIDIQHSKIYVGTDEGVIYAVTYPLP